MSLGRWLVGVASWLVPREMRDEWRAEWNAELDAHDRRHAGWPSSGARSTRRGLLRRSLGAFADALWVATHHWHALRLFGRHWRLAATAWLSLSVAMAATVIGFAAYDVLLLRPPGVASPASLRVIHIRSENAPFGEASYPEFQDYRTRARAFADIAAFPFAVTTTSFSFAAASRQVLGTQVSPNFFRVLGITPVAGRLDFPEGAGELQAVVISARFWNSLGRPGDIVGAAVRVNGQPMTVLGIAPASFRGMTWGFDPEIWTTLRTSMTLFGGDPSQMTNRTTAWLHMVGRLASGVTGAQAQSDAITVAAGLAREHPDTNAGKSAVLTPISVTPPEDRGWAETVLGALVVVVLLSLIVACANVTNLLLGLSMSRRHEALVRAALGASRWQLIVPIVRGSAILGLVSGVTGAILAWLLLDRLSNLSVPLGGVLPSISINLRPDLMVFVAAIVVSIAAGVLVGLGPALRTAANGLSGAIARERPGFGPDRARLRHASVVVQMAVAALAAVAIGVSVHSLISLEHVPLGFSARHLEYGAIDLRDAADVRARGPALYDRIRARLREIPGVEAVSLASDVPLLGYNTDRAMPDTVAPGSKSEWTDVPFAVVDTAYFSAIGMPVLQGRAFEAGDTAAHDEVVIVNETLARRNWPGQNPLGRRIRMENEHRLATVVGVVKDGRYGDIDEAQLPFMYLALSQHWQTHLMVVARTAAGRGDLERTVGAIDPDVSLGAMGVMTLDDTLSLSLLLPRVIVGTTVVFGVLALALALFGLYSAVFYSVSQRRTEIGIRTALGAAPRHVFALALRESGWVAIAGAAAGLGGGLLLLPVAASIFYGVGSFEPVVLGLVAAATSALAIGTTYLVVRPWTRLAAADLLRLRP